MLPTASREGVCSDSLVVLSIGFFQKRRTSAGNRCFIEKTCRWVAFWPFQAHLQVKPTGGSRSLGASRRSSSCRHPPARLQSQITHTCPFQREAFRASSAKPSRRTFLARFPGSYPGNLTGTTGSWAPEMDVPTKPEIDTASISES